MVNHFNLQGVNFKSIREIVYEHRYIDFELSLLVLKDPDVHPLLQSAYLDFVISAYVDVIVQESGADINNLWHSYVSSIPFCTIQIQIPVHLSEL